MKNRTYTAVRMDAVKIVLLGKKTWSGMGRASFDGQLCEDLPKNLNEGALKKIINWYEEQSVQKPLKCSGEPLESLPFNTSLSTPVLISRKCKEYEEPMLHSFRGKIEDFKYEGSGKFKKNYTLDDSYVHDICFSRHAVLNTLAHNMTGTFKDGLPQGLFKMDGEDDSTIIGSFRKGHLHSRFRRWDGSKTLQKLGYFLNQMVRGMCWERHGDTLVYSLCENTKKLKWRDEFRYALAIVNMSLIIVGENHQDLGFISNARPVKVDQVELNDCILTLKWTKIPGEPFNYHVNKNQLDYQRSYTDFCTPSTEFNEGGEAVRSSLRSWIGLFQDYVVGDNLWRFGPSSAPLNPNAPKLVSDLQHEAGTNYTAKFQGKETRLSLVKGAVQENHQPVGMLRFHVLDTFVDPIFSNASWVEVGFSIYDGIIGNIGLVILKDSRYMTMRLKDGVIHGPVNLIGRKGIFPYSAEYGSEAANLLSRQADLGGIFNYENGFPVGQAWLNLIGGGFFVGRLDKHHKFTGSNISFVYPDYEAAYVGQFDDFVMQAARKSKVIGEKCSERGIKELKFAEPWGPELHYSPPTNETFTKGPRTSDPFEDITVELAQSKIPGSGQGVFALRDIKAGQFACPYSGLFYRNEEEKQVYNAMYLFNTSLSKDERRYAKKYTINTAHSSARIDIPKHLDQPDSWHPTLGPKVNTDFPRRHMNCQYGDFDHPVYGLIQGVHAIKDIPAGSELFTDYGYGAGAGFPHDFPWYHAAKKEYLKEMEILDKKAEEEEKKRLEEEGLKKKKKKSKKDKKPVPKVKK
eukprot:TCALIF_03414-PA protein Name:"Similar to setd7 Histone-lysine N-methyltransferase SETD7 (Halocynthia roretzi)" AED:0.32 eAED:0.39 QI:0/0/0/0.5/1/1/2/0/799